MDPVAAVETRHRAMRLPCPLISRNFSSQESTGHGGFARDEVSKNEGD
jgi:hypothetical protein